MADFYLLIIVLNRQRQNSMRHRTVFKEAFNSFIKRIDESIFIWYAKLRSRRSLLIKYGKTSY